jgi:hypothetical protein
MGTLAQLHRSDATAAPPPSPERAALAEAIAARDAANVRLSGLHGVADRATRNVRAAQEALDVAQGGVDAARAADGRAATDALLAGAATPPASLPAARAAVVACEDALAAATTARDALQAETAELEGHAFYRDAKVHTAAIAVMRDEMAATTRALIVEIGANDARRADLGKALALLVRHGIIKAQGPDAMPGVLELQCRFDSMRTFPFFDRPGASRTAAAWEAAIAALEADAAAPVPVLK